MGAGCSVCPCVQDQKYSKDGTPVRRTSNKALRLNKVAILAKKGQALLPPKSAANGASGNQFGKDQAQQPVVKKALDSQENVTISGLIAQNKKLQEQIHDVQIESVKWKNECRRQQLAVDDELVVHSLDHLVEVLQEVPGPHDRSSVLDLYWEIDNELKKNLESIYFG